MQHTSDSGVMVIDEMNGCPTIGGCLLKLSLLVGAVGFCLRHNDVNADSRLRILINCLHCYIMYIIRIYFSWCSPSSGLWSSEATTTSVRTSTSVSIRGPV